MNAEQDEPRPQRRITWRTQITIRPARGLLSRADVERAIAGVSNASPVLDIVVAERLDVVDPDAGIPLGYLLHPAEEVNVTAHGRGVPYLLNALHLGLRMEQQFRGELANPKQRHPQRARGTALGARTGGRAEQPGLNPAAGR